MNKKISPLLGILAMAIGVFGILFLISSWLPSFSSVTGYRNASVGDAGQDSFALTTGYAGKPMMANAGIAVSQERMMKSDFIMPPQPVPGGSVATDVSPENRLIIKNGYVSLVVTDVSQSIANIHAYAGAHKGFVVSSNIQKIDRAFIGNVTFRIPSAQFEESMTAIRAMGEVASQNTTGQDVTEEFVDVEAQLKNLRASESQFLEIMKRAQKIEDILAVQRELTQVRGQIDQLEGRKKYLNQSAAYSLITVNLSTDPDKLPVVEQKDTWKPIAVIKEAARNLLTLGKGFANTIIWLVVFTPVWVILFFLGRYGYRKLHKLWH